MNKELASFFILFIALFVGALYYTNVIQSPIILSLNYVKKSYHNSVDFVSNTIDKHFYQSEQIQDLTEQLQQYENNHLVMQQLASELNDLYQENKSRLKLFPQVALVRTISYAKFSNLNQVWIDFEDFNKSKIYGLTHKELVAGIVVEKESKPLALLNKDIKSSYAVYVGSKNAPGIAHGNNAQNIVVEFIPAWFEIESGDEVITSGLDNIFFQGLKVGKVISVTKSQGYQNAVVDPYYDSSNPNYFHIITEVR